MIISQSGNRGPFVQGSTVPPIEDGEGIMFYEDTPEKSALRAMLKVQLMRLKAEGASDFVIGHPERWVTEYNYNQVPKTLVSSCGSEKVTIMVDDNETTVAFCHNGEDYALSENDFPLFEFRKWMHGLSMLIEGL